MELQYFGQIVSVTHVMSIQFKNNIKIDLTETEYYTPIQFFFGWGGEGVEPSWVTQSTEFNIKFHRTMLHHGGICFVTNLTWFDAGKT
jgi:hypothetical protein